MNLMSYIINQVYRTIPIQILTEVFGKQPNTLFRKTTPVTIDENIKSKVIRSRLLVDCNLLGGRITLIDLSDVPYEVKDPFVQLYIIPPEKTNNREIISVLSINYITYNANYVSSYPSVGRTNSGYSDLSIAGQRVADSFGSIDHISTAQAELVGYNTVIVRDQSRPVKGYELRAILAYDEELSCISPRSFPAFAKAGVMLVKSYIYNELAIKMDSGMLEQGQNLGRFKEIVDSYEGEEEKYGEFLEMTLRKVLFMSDHVSYSRFLRAQINPGL